MYTRDSMDYFVRSVYLKVQHKTVKIFECAFHATNLNQHRFFMYTWDSMDYFVRMLYLWGKITS